MQEPDGLEQLPLDDARLTHRIIAHPVGQRTGDELEEQNEAVRRRGESFETERTAGDPPSAQTATSMFAYSSATGGRPGSIRQ